jgi:predicted ferric reductase
MDTRPYATEDTQLPGRTRPTVVAVPAAPRRAPSGGPPPTLAPVAPPQANLPLGLLVGAVGVGALIAVLTIPAWVPTLARSLVGAQPQAAWYLSRASAFVAFGLLWISMVSGLIITNKMARVWPGVFTAFDLHQYTSLLGLGFAAFHALVLLADHYIGFTLVQILVPFAGPDYRPLWVGLGQIAFYLSILVTFTFYIRKQIGNRLWHVIHLLSYLLFALALLHGVLSGTDSGNVWVNMGYWAGGVSLLVLTLYRLMIQRVTAARQ